MNKRILIFILILYPMYCYSGVDTAGYKVINNYYINGNNVVINNYGDNISLKKTYKGTEPFYKSSEVDSVRLQEVNIKENTTKDNSKLPFKIMFFYILCVVAFFILLFIVTVRETE